MKQREIWFAKLNPMKGKEWRGNWPVIIISGHTMSVTSL